MSQFADRGKSLLYYMSFKRGVMPLISNVCFFLIISIISRILSVVLHGVYGTTQQGKRNFKDQNSKGRSSPQDQRHMQTACFETPVYMAFFV